MHSFVLNVYCKHNRHITLHMKCNFCSHTSCNLYIRFIAIDADKGVGSLYPSRKWQSPFGIFYIYKWSTATLSGWELANHQFPAVTEFEMCTRNYGWVNIFHPTKPFKSTEIRIFITLYFLWLMSNINYFPELKWATIN